MEGNQGLSIMSAAGQVDLLVGLSGDIPPEIDQLVLGNIVLAKGVEPLHKLLGQLRQGLQRLEDDSSSQALTILDLKYSCNGAVLQIIVTLGSFKAVDIELFGSYLEQQVTPGMLAVFISKITAARREAAQERSGQQLESFPGLASSGFVVAGNI